MTHFSGDEALWFSGFVAMRSCAHFALDLEPRISAPEVNLNWEEGGEVFKWFARWYFYQSLL